MGRGQWKAGGRQVCRHTGLEGARVVRVVHYIKTTHTCRTARRVSSKRRGVGSCGCCCAVAARAWRHGCLTAVLHDRSSRPFAVDCPEPTRRRGRATCSGSRRSPVFLPFAILFPTLEEGDRAGGYLERRAPYAPGSPSSASQAMLQRRASRPWVVEIYFSKWSSAGRPRYL